MPDRQPALTADQHALLHALATCDDDHRPYLRHYCAELALPAERIHAILRYFATLGLATHGPVCDNDTGAPNGSTWWLTETGVALRQRAAPA